MPTGLPIGALGGDAVRDLHETIKKFNTQTAEATKWLLRLTWVIAVLTAVMAAGLGVQICLALRGPAQ